MGVPGDIHPGLDLLISMSSMLQHLLHDPHKLLLFLITLFRLLALHLPRTRPVNLVIHRLFQQIPLFLLIRVLLNPKKVLLLCPSMKLMRQSERREDDDVV